MFLFTIIGVGTSALIVHESVHWFGVEEPTRMCFGYMSGEGMNEQEGEDLVGVVYYEGQSFWFSAEWFALLVSFIYGIVLSIIVGHWFGNRTGGKKHERKQ